MLFKFGIYFTEQHKTYLNFFETHHVSKYRLYFAYERVCKLSEVKAKVKPKLSFLYDNIVIKKKGRLKEGMAFSSNVYFMHYREMTHQATCSIAFCTIKVGQYGTLTYRFDKLYIKIT